ncbi:hypothetical protein RKD45_002896 [Streptomyces griseus]
MLGQLVAGLGQVQTQLLESARDAHGPAGVTEEALDLADDGRHRERRELHAAAELEAVDRLDQADGADLDDVLHRLAAGAEAGGGELDEGQVQLDEGVADVRVLVGALLEGFEPREERLRQGPGVHRADFGVVRDVGKPFEALELLDREVVVGVRGGGAGAGARAGYGARGSGVGIGRSLRTCRRREVGTRYVEPG